MMSIPLFEQAVLEKIHRSLKRRKETISVAESVTSGFLQAALSQAEFASEFFQGGLTAYNLGQKYKHLQVEPIHAEQHNSVSEPVARQMALGACQHFCSDWGIGVCGYATPVPESGNKVFAVYAIAHHTKIVAKGKLMPAKAEPLDLQLEYVNRILRALAGKLR